jgi:urease accessory protein
MIWAMGAGRLVARRIDGRTVLAEAHATAPLRFVRPDFAATSAGVCLVTFGGGLVDGDAITTEIEVEESATLVVFTQSSTKAFRGKTSQTITAKVRGTLVLLPDPVAAFKDASYTQRVDVALEGGGACLLLDGVTSGRAAFGERWAMQALDLKTTITDDGRPVAVDALRLDQADGSIADRAASFDCFLTLIAVRAPLADDSPAPPSRDLAIATSPLLRTEGRIVRIAASTPVAALATARSRLRNLPDIDVVDPFASRQ